MHLAGASEVSGDSYLCRNNYPYWAAKFEAGSPREERRERGQGMQRPGYGAPGWERRTERRRLPSGVPHPVHGSHPGPAEYPSLFPFVMS